MKTCSKPFIACPELVNTINNVIKISHICDAFVIKCKEGALL